MLKQCDLYFIFLHTRSHQLIEDYITIITHLGVAILKKK